MPEQAPEPPKRVWYRVYLRPGNPAAAENILEVEQSQAIAVLSAVANGSALLFTDKKGKQWAYVEGYIKVCNISVLSS